MHTLHKRILVLVKTYPNPSQKYQESVCVAGVTQENEWIRLYPVLFRSLDEEERFKKYQWIDLNVKKSSDQRPFTYKPMLDSMRTSEIIGTKNNWKERKKWVYALPVNDSMCSVQRDANKCLEEGRPVARSLAAIKPASVEELVVEPDVPDWTHEQKEWINQQGLFDKKHIPLEKIPYKFYYRYRCSEKGCKGHEQSIIDWEIMQLYRRLKRSGRSAAGIIDGIKKKWMGELCGSDKDILFFVGNGYQTPKSFMVLGVFYPKKGPDQMNLFG